MIAYTVYVYGAWYINALHHKMICLRGAHFLAFSVELIL